MKSTEVYHHKNMFYETACNDFIDKFNIIKRCVNETCKTCEEINDTVFDAQEKTRLIFDHSRTFIDKNNSHVHIFSPYVPHLNNSYECLKLGYREIPNIYGPNATTFVRVYSNNQRESFDTELSPASPSGYVYLISESGTENYKVGKAKSVVERLKQLQTANPRLLEVLHKCFFEDAFKAETSCKLMLSSHKCKLGGVSFLRSP